MNILSPAKINWFLYVLGKREDGFHEILSPMQKISLYDSLTFEKSESVNLRDNRGITDNIIHKAIEAMKEHNNAGSRGVYVELQKEIPLSAGLGGGSSNAAMTITALNTIWSMNLSSGEKMEIAAEIGSDVPFFLGEGLAMVRGRGEILMPYRSEQSYVVLLVNPGIEISAQWAYEHLEHYMEITNESDVITDFLNGLNERDYVVMKDYMHNSLEGPVFRQYPEIRDIKEALLRKGARLSMMSGSGSTVFGVFSDAQEAVRVQQHFSKLWTRVVKTLQE